MKKLKTLKSPGEQQKADAMEVADFMNATIHPQIEVIKALRQLITEANSELTEHIKWKAPSFCFNGDDRITLNLHRNEYILLVFHKGVKSKEVKGAPPFFIDETGLLEWISNERATIKVKGLAELGEKKVAIISVINNWIRYGG